LVYTYNEKSISQKHKTIIQFIPASIDVIVAAVDDVIVVVIFGN